MPLERMLKFFEYKHLPATLQVVSKPFCDLAKEMNNLLVAGPERTECLRKLLEAKDCAVRARLEEGWSSELTKEEGAKNG